MLAEVTDKGVKFLTWKTGSSYSQRQQTSRFTLSDTDEWAAPIPGGSRQEGGSRP